MAACERWGFNFLHGHPVADHKQYSWERVPPTNSMPQMYTLSRAAHVREMSMSTSTSAFNDLLDERAERSNRNMDTSSEDESMMAAVEQTRLSQLVADELQAAATATEAAAKEAAAAIVATKSASSISTPQSPLLPRSSPREKRQPRITGEQIFSLSLPSFPN